MENPIDKREQKSNAALEAIQNAIEKDDSPKTSKERILESKRKIVSLVKTKEFDEAKILFFNTFSDTQPADMEFLSNLYFECSKIDGYSFFYDIIVRIQLWYIENDDFEKLRSDVTRIYIDNLVLKGNNLIIQRDERADFVKKKISQMSPRMRVKQNINTDKPLAKLSSQALEKFELAHQLAPDNMSALNGLKDCYNFIEDYQNYEIVLKKIESLLMRFRPTDAAEIQKTKEAEEAEKARIEYENFQKKVEELQTYFNEKKDKEFDTLFSELYNQDNPYTPILILRARLLARQRHFKDSDALMEQCEKDTIYLPLINEAKDEIQKTKESLYRKAAIFYLKIALKKGSSFGQTEFKKAKAAIEHVAFTSDRDLELYDMYYTVLKYMKDEKKAFEVRGMIYSIDPDFVTSFDRNSQSKLCFIASFAYSERVQEIEVFRWFRREFLLTNAYGRLLNCLYVRYSPYLVKGVENIPYSALFFRCILFLPLTIIKFLQKVQKWLEK